MKIISTNIAQIRTIAYRGKQIKTGIYKQSTSKGVFLEKEDVKNDEVVDRRYHGGEDKACYLYSFNHYKYWENRYPNLDFEMGMFGENLTIENLDESKIFIGDIFSIGDAIVQVSQPREPCFKLGVKFNSMKMVKDFLKSDFPGFYVSILQEGRVKPNDFFKLIESPEKEVSILDVYKILTFKGRQNVELIDFKKVLNSRLLASASNRNAKKMYEIFKKL